MPMSEIGSVIGELDSVLANGSVEKRIAILMRVTDLFLSNPAKLTTAQTSLFDDVISRLAAHIEHRTLAELSTRLAPIPNAPMRVIHQLASDDAIEVAGPILAMSEQLSEKSLIEIAKTKSQFHLNKIAERRQLTTTVTDVLVNYGDHKVCNTLAENPGASFSNIGISTLVMRSDGDDGLIEKIARRADIPSHVFEQLLSYATDQARERLLAARPENTDAVKAVLDKVSAHASWVAATAKDRAEAQNYVQSFSQDTALTRRKILELADGKQISAMIAALSVLSGITTSLIDRLICDQSCFGSVVLCKAIGLDWSVAHAVLMAQWGDRDIPASQFEQLCDDYDRLTASTAARLLRFWQGRMKVQSEIHDVRRAS